MEKFTSLSEERGLNLKATELRLGLPGCESPEREGLFISGAKRVFSDVGSGKWVFTGSEKNAENGSSKQTSMVSPKAVGSKKPFGSAAKAQVVGWPPIRSFRKNSMVSNAPKNNADVDNKSGSDCLYVKVSMDGAPYLRKVDLKTYKSYTEMSSALGKMFSCFTIGQCGSHGGPGREGLNESRLTDLIDGSEYVLTYEDKDGDWMLVGDVPWELFTDSCRRMRIMKSSDAVGLAPRAIEKCRNRN